MFAAVDRRSLRNSSGCESDRLTLRRHWPRRSRAGSWTPDPEQDGPESEQDSEESRHERSESERCDPIVGVTSDGDREGFVIGRFHTHDMIVCIGHVEGEPSDAGEPAFVVLDAIGCRAEIDRLTIGVHDRDLDLGHARSGVVRPGHVAVTTDFFQSSNAFDVDQVFTGLDEVERGVASHRSAGEVGDGVLAPVATDDPQHNRARSTDNDQEHADADQHAPTWRRAGHLSGPRSAADPPRGRSFRRVAPLRREHTRHRRVRRIHQG